MKKKTVDEAGEEANQVIDEAEEEDSYKSTIRLLLSLLIIRQINKTKKKKTVKFKPLAKFKTKLLNCGVVQDTVDTSSQSVLLLLLSFGSTGC